MQFVYGEFCIFGCWWVCRVCDFIILFTNDCGFEVVKILINRESYLKKLVMVIVLVLNIVAKIVEECNWKFTLRFWGWEWSWLSFVVNRLYFIDKR